MGGGRAGHVVILRLHTAQLSCAAHMGPNTAFLGHRGATGERSRHQGSIYPKTEGSTPVLQPNEVGEKRGRAFSSQVACGGGTCAHTGSPGETQDWWWVRPAWLSWAREPGRSAATDGASDRHAEILLAEHLDGGDTEELMEYLECGPEGIPSNQQLVRMGDNNNTQSIADYLAQLLKDKKQLAAFPNVFIHMERLLDDGEYSRDCL